MGAEPLHRYIAGLIPQSPASDAGNVSKTRPVSQVRRFRGVTVRVDQCFSVVRAVEGPVFVSLGSSCNQCDWGRRPVRFVRLALKAVMQSDGDFYGRMCRLPWFRPIEKHTGKIIQKHLRLILISNFRRVLNAVLCLLGNLPASELLVPTFRNLLVVPSS